ncbi:hypothetical protein ACFW04_011936 [Cataglyphis niger]
MEYGVEIWGWRERKELKRLQERYLRWVLGLNWGTPSYMVREELQKEKLRDRAVRRAWGFEKKLEEGRGSEITRRCWEKLRERCRRKKELSKWEEERRGFFEDKGMNMMEVEAKRSGVLDFGYFVKKDTEMDEKERWERIKGSR